jgi:hypothetical protein
MKNCILLTSLLLALSLKISAQERKLYSKVNFLGAGYGIEYFASPKFSFTGVVTFDEDFNSSGRNSHQLGFFAGTTIRFSKIIYVDVELGPGYDFGNLNDYKFNLLGNVGFGFIF